MAKRWQSNPDIQGGVCRVRAESSRCLLMSIIAVNLIGRIPLLAIVSIVKIYKHEADIKLHVQQTLHLFCQ